MTAKQFFKGTAFKCLAVLTAILLISGILLAVCWGFMEVTDDERFQRKIAVVYPGETVTAVEQSLDGKSTSYGVTNIKKYWLITEKHDYIVEAKSKGYNGGITCWVTITMNEGLTAIQGIRSVQIYKADAADELVGNIKNYVYQKFTEDYAPDIEYEYGTEGSDQYIGTGASHTLTAVCNCVNAAIKFINGEEDPYAEYEYRDLIDMSSTTWTVSGTTVNYTIVTGGSAPAKAFTINIKVDVSGADPVITEYEITGYGSVAGKGKTDEEYNALVFDGYANYKLADVKALIGADDKIVTGGTITTGATRSNEQCVFAAAFALANYSRCLASPKGGN
ncbi:MAG: hypothetical protein K2N47_01370 [Clostridia bacterium]|nr:hypothetical protein [Clostridia bacterium]